MIGISLWLGADAVSVDDVVSRVQDAADSGFESAWLPQTASLDALAALAVAARVVPRIRLGTAVVPIQGRHPLPLAQQALTVADAAGPGRFTLGIGVTHKMVSEGWYGVPYRDAVRLCREELAALAPLLSTERKADFTGELLTARVTISMSVEPPGLVLAALGPKMIELAGRYTDGTVTWMTGVRTLATHVVPHLRDVMAKAGRGEPRVIAGLPVCVTDDVAGARERLMPVMAGAAQLPSYRRMLALEGAEQPTDIAIVGDEATVRERIAELEAAGVTELLANPLGSDEERRRTRELLVSITRG
ncbi:MAG TPA: TIGR03564 family F420-dependent LLM class oxidoreductase [Acidimicrobiales bacterium]